ncbi:MAG: SBBP repeat-containing protein [Bryobacterales bacterium]|nr:SBBP repeat-containing protein [Bryobacterales bacterium]
MGEQKDHGFPFAAAPAIVAALGCALLQGATPLETAATLNVLPLSFEWNRGQVDPRVKFVARAPGMTAFLTRDAAVLSLAKSEHERYPVRVRFRGAAAGSEAYGVDPLPGISNYLIGGDPAKWTTNVPHYAKARFRGVYPGIDLVYHGERHNLEFDFVVSPGADPRLIELEIEGGNIRIGRNGDLVIRIPGGVLRQKRPVIYQESNGARQTIAGGFVRRGRNRAGFRIARYDRTKPLIIDPPLVYSTYLGGSPPNGSQAMAVAVDPAGNAYLAGFTGSPDFPTTPGAAGATGNYFVTKLSGSGSSLVYSTLIGGLKQVNAIAVDGAGNAVIAGSANGAATTANAYQSCSGGGVYIGKLNSTGTAFLYSGCLHGGDNNESAMAVAVDSSGYIYTGGFTRNCGFPTINGFQLTNPYQDAHPDPVCGGIFEGFVAKLDPSAATGPASLLYSTYVGDANSGSNTVSGIAVGAMGMVYAVGNTEAETLATSDGVIRTVNGYYYPGFLMKVNSAVSGLASKAYFTYLNGTDASDQTRAVAVDASGAAYVTGVSRSSDFPVTTAPIGPNGSHAGAFVTKVVAGLPNWAYSTVLTGNGLNEANAIAVDGSGNAHVTGRTRSTDFPAVNPLPNGAVNHGGQDAFVSILNPAGSGLIFSTLLGGGGNDFARGIALDRLNNIYLAGETTSADFPILNAYQPAYPGGAEGVAFAAKLGIAASADLSINKLGGPNPVVTGSDLTYTLTVANQGPDAAPNVVVTDNLPASLTFTSCAASGGGVCGGVANARTIGFASLAPGQRETITITAKVNADAADGTVISNKAAINAAVNDPAGNNESTLNVTADNPAPVIGCPADVSTDATSASGAVVTYPAPSVSDNTPIGAAVCSLSSGALFPVGKTAVSCSVTDSGQRTSSCSFNVTVTSGSFAPDLIVTKAGPPTASAGANISYVVSVSNIGSGAAQNVTMTDSIPANTTFVSAGQTSGPPFGCTTPAAGGTGAVVCSIPTFPANATASFAIVVNTANAAGVIGNTAIAAHSLTDPTPGNNSATVNTTLLGPDVSVTKIGPGSVAPRANLSYTVTVANQGPGLARNVAMTDAIPANTTFVSAIQTSGPPFNCTAPGVGLTGTVACSIATLAANASAGFTIVVSVNPAATGSVSNTAAVTELLPDPVPGNNSMTVSTVIVPLPPPPPAQPLGPVFTMGASYRVLPAAPQPAPLGPVFTMGASYRILPAPAQPEPLGPVFTMGASYRILPAPAQPEPLGPVFTMGASYKILPAMARPASLGPLFNIEFASPAKQNITDAPRVLAGTAPR